MTNEGLKFGALVLGIALVIVIIVLIVKGHKDKYGVSPKKTPKERLDEISDGPLKGEKLLAAHKAMKKIAAESPRGWWIVLPSEDISQIHPSMQKMIRKAWKNRGYAAGVRRGAKGPSKEERKALTAALHPNFDLSKEVPVGCAGCGSQCASCFYGPPPGGCGCCSGGTCQCEGSCYNAPYDSCVYQEGGEGMCGDPGGMPAGSTPAEWAKQSGKYCNGPGSIIGPDAPCCTSSIWNNC